MRKSTVAVDDRGRIMLPYWVRKKYLGRNVIIHQGKADWLIIEPVMSVDEAFGSLKGKLDIEGFRTEHAKER